MSKRYMLLPAKHSYDYKLVSIPDDFQDRDAHRHVTALIATIQEEDDDYTWDDIEPVLEEHGFVTLDYELGPDLDITG